MSNLWKRLHFALANQPTYMILINCKECGFSTNILIAAYEHSIDKGHHECELQYVDLLQ